MLKAQALCTEHVCLAELVDGGAPCCIYVQVQQLAVTGSLCRVTGLPASSAARCQASSSQALGDPDMLRAQALSAAHVWLCERMDCGLPCSVLGRLWACGSGQGRLLAT